MPPAALAPLRLGILVPACQESNHLFSKLGPSSADSSDEQPESHSMGLAAVQTLGGELLDTKAVACLVEQHALAA